MEQSFMKEQKVLPLVLSMSLPMVISMAVNSLYNIVDSYFVAKYSEDAMTALALVFPVQNFINAVVIGFGRKRPAGRPRRGLCLISCMELCLRLPALRECRCF